MKRLMLSGLVAFSVWQSLAFADDTDIYLLQPDNSPKPYMMLTFDYRNDMASTFCNGLSACRDAVGLEAGEADADSPLMVALKDITGDPDLAKVNNMQALLAVLQVVFSKFEGIYVGLMMPNVTNGGTILRGYQEFVVERDADGNIIDDDVTGAKQELIDILNAIPIPSTGNAFHAVSPKEMHYELWRYLNGGGVALGDETVDNFPAMSAPPADPTEPDPHAPLRVTATEPYYDDQIIDKVGDAATSNDLYLSPFDQSDVPVADQLDYSCTRLFEVYASSGNAGGNSDDDLDTYIEADMDASALDPNFDGMLSYMAGNDLVNNTLAPGDQTMKTWFVQMGNAATRTDDWAALMGTADQYMEVNGSGATLRDVQAIFEGFFVEAISKSSTFVSASVPVNVFNRIQTLDNFYIALFEANAARRWPGNLKKLRLADTDDPPNGRYDDIVDVKGQSAFNDEDGRIRYDALTYWTDPLALPPADAERSEVEGRDGRAVSRGGAGQKIPGVINGGSVGVGETTTTDTRQVYVEPDPATAVNGIAEDFIAFDADTATATALQTLLGAADVAEATDLIKWGRGLDVDDEDNDTNTINRRWLLGDAIHSRPLALNYGATGGGYDQDNPNIRLFMGTNDGFFHIFENTTAAGEESGEEVFAFIPRESLPLLKQLRVDNDLLDHPYGVDGEPVALVADADLDGTIEAGDEVYVYVGMRRGGKSYYALDVSSPSTTPQLQWKITKTAGGNFDELGYTFSTPRVAKVRHGALAEDVLIFAGGYDLNKDTGALSGADSEGNAIYIVNARTGALVWKAVGGTGTDSNTVFHHNGMTHSIPSSVATLDSNSNGVVDRAYVGDTGGTVWRVDLPEGNDTDHRANNWQVTKLAALGGNAEVDDRRFFHPPDIVQTRDGAGQYDGVLIASGDRANPLETDDQNYFYLIKDRNTVSGSPPTTALVNSDFTDTTGCLQDTDTVDGVNCTDFDYSNGWKVKLNSDGSRDGEKGLASPITIDGDVYFTSYAPTPGLNSCEPSEGNGYLYVVNLKDGTAVYNNRDMEIGPGIPPQVTALGDSALIIPGAGMLENPNDENGSKERNKLVDTDGKSMYIIYWREPGVDKL